MINYVKTLRESKKLTQSKMAKKIGISRNGLQNIESGKSLPMVDTAFKIAHLFGKRIDEIFIMEGYLK